MKIKNITLILSVLLITFIYFGIIQNNATYDAQNDLEKTELKNATYVSTEYYPLTINKVDSESKPVEGATFDIYTDEMVGIELVESKNFRGPDNTTGQSGLSSASYPYYMSSYYDDISLSSRANFKLDLPNDLAIEYTLTVNASTTLSDVGSSCSINLTADGYSSRLMYTKDSLAAKDYTTTLQGGKDYYLTLSYSAGYGGRDEDFYPEKIMLNSIILEAKKYTTDANGQINIKALGGETVYIKELSAPEGYIIPNEITEYTMGCHYENKVTIINEKPLPFIINKADDEGKPVPGAVFDVYNDEPINIQYVNGTRFSKVENKNGETGTNSSSYPYQISSYYYWDVSYATFLIDLPDNIYQDYELTVNAEIDSANDKCPSWATVTESVNYPNVNVTEGQFIKGTGKVEAKDYTTTLQGGKDYYVHFCYNGHTGDVPNENDRFIINSIKVEGKKYTTDANGQINDNTLRATGKVYIRELEAPKGYVKLNEVKEHTRNSSQDSNEVTIINQKAKVNVYHYIKGTTNKVAETEIYTMQAGQTSYTTSAKTDLKGLLLAKDENGDDIIPENATGEYGNSDIDVYYYYEPAMINLTIHHYLNGTTEKLAEDEIISIPLEFVADENGIYGASIKYTLESNENYKELIEKYLLSKVTSTTDEDVDILEILESDSDFEISYFYEEEKEESTDSETSKDENKQEENKNEENKEETKQPESSKDENKQEEVKNEENKQEEPKQPETIIETIIENAKTGDYIVAYVVILMLASAIVLTIRLRKYNNRNKK